MKSGIKRLTISALLVAFSLALFAIEMLIPPFPFAPSAKIGLANIVTLFMISNKKLFNVSDCFLVLISRCILGAFLTGRLMSVVFSLLGGISAILSMLIMRKLLSEKNVISMSISGAVFHNIGQMLTALCFYGTFSVIYYLPALFLTGVLSGILTGLCVVLVNKSKFYYNFLNF